MILEFIPRGETETVHLHVSQLSVKQWRHGLILLPNQNSEDLIKRLISINVLHPFGKDDVMLSLNHLQGRSYSIG